MTQTTIRGNWPGQPAPKGKKPRSYKSHPHPGRGIAVKNHHNVARLINGECVTTENLQRGRALKASVLRVLQHRRLDDVLWPTLKQTDNGCKVWLRKKNETQ